MGILSWIVFGLLAGAVARLFVSGTGGIGCLGTIAVGIVGALIGGLVGQVVLGEDVEFGWDVGPFLLAVVGAVVFLLVLRAVGGRGRL
ncbi:MAG TPA: GlsB/YeaQ/YmgE family stress response membrane protein [Gaiellaceae bacterium]|nr:GlsB/YeaQ/YmgE family stress response membrane protein [Gaiellaceae bacterium]